MGIMVGTLVTQYNPTYGTFTCETEPKDKCIGMVISLESWGVTVNWLQTCDFHTDGPNQFLYDELWEIGHIF